MTTRTTNQRKELTARFAQLLRDITEGIVQRRIDNPPGFQDALQEALWRLHFLMTLKLGTGLQTVDNFCRVIKAMGGQVSPWASYIMRHPDFVGSVSPSLVELDLHTATTEEILGQKGTNGTLKEIYAGITGRMGGELLPAEAGPQLRRQYTNQPSGECLFVAMKPIEDSNDYLSVFSIRHIRNNLLLLSASYGYFNSVWFPAHRWVFSRPRRRPACR